MGRRRIVLIGPVVLIVLAGLAGCGARVDTPSSTAGPSVRAPVVSGTLPAAGSSTVPEPPTTAPPTTAAPTTAASATTVAPTTAPASTPSTAAGGLAAFCDAAERYGADDLLGLGERVVADPGAFLGAYETMLAEAPGDLRPLVTDMGPLSRQVVTLVRMKEITTAPALQAWLANTAPRDQLETWVKAQQQLVPAIQQRCA